MSDAGVDVAPGVRLRSARRTPSSPHALLSLVSAAG